MRHYLRVQENLRARPKRWLITGVAGFIGSNILEMLLNLDQEVIGLDNLSLASGSIGLGGIGSSNIGSSQALSDVQNSVSATRWSRFSFYKTDITSFAECKAAMQDVDFVLHHAGLNSQSVDSCEVNRVNTCGFLNVLEAARESQVKRLVYASSSPANFLPKPLSNNSYLNELHATTCHRDDTNGKNNDFTTIALRYQNVFGKRQQNHSSNPALVPYWIEQLLDGQQCTLYGSKSNFRDFVFIDDVVQANILAAVASDASANECYDITSSYYLNLQDLFEHLTKAFDTYYPELTVNMEADCLPSYLEQQPVDQLDISKAIECLKFETRGSLVNDIAATISWYHQAYMQKLLTHA